MKKLLCIVFVISCFIGPLHAEKDQPVKERPARFLTERRKKLLGYCGLSMLGAYAFLNLLNMNSKHPVSQATLIQYSVGLPTVLGAGFYGALSLGLIPQNSEAQA